MASEQCDWTNMAGRRCAYVAGHSGEHLYPQHNEDLSHEIRLRNAQDVRDREIATLRRDADARDAEIAELRACLTEAYGWMPSIPESPHRGSCGPESGCDGGCADLSAMHDSKEGRELMQLDARIRKAFGVASCRDGLRETPKEQR
jgi:hypothetical protein